MNLLMEAALRALVVAVTVWAGLRVFRVRNVPAQKAAWGLVLLCAVAMPAVMRWRVLPNSVAVKVPAISTEAWLNTLPVRDALLLAARAEGRADAPQVRLTQASEPAPEMAGPGATDSAAARVLSTAPAVSTVHFDRPAARVRQADQGVDQQAATPVNHYAERPPAPAGTVQLQTVEFQPMVTWQEEASFLGRAAARVKGFVKWHVAAMGWALYLAVFAVLLIRMLYGVDQALKLWWAAEEFVPYPQDDPGYGLAMRFSRKVASPVTIGSGVLLPYECMEWDAEKLRIVLAHERAHVRQGDFYLQLLAGLYTAVFWFSPLGWWLKSKLSDLGEVISDRAGLNEAASRTSYAQILLEFAALPRPTVTGVAMARTRNLSERIERLLNESSFGQAFAGTRLRVLLAVLLVPVALFAGTALVRVEAASTGHLTVGQDVAAPPAPAAAPSPAAVPSPAAIPDPAAAPVEPQQAADPAPAAQDIAIPAPAPAPAPAPSPDVVPAVAPVPPVPPVPAVTARYSDVHVAADYLVAAKAYAQDASSSHTITSSGSSHSVSTSSGNGYSYAYSSDGDSWALITDPTGKVTFSGDWNDGTKATIDKARKLSNGKFLWFDHDGKSYFIDDPAVVNQIEAMEQPIRELGRKQEELGKQQEALGRQQEELGRKQEQASIPTPDISKEMKELNEAVAKLNAKQGGTVNAEELADLQGKIGEIQGRLGDLEGKVGDRQSEFGEQQGKLGEQEGKLGEQEGKLGEQEGRLSQEADRKVRSIIDQSLKSGKAKPIE